MGLIPVARRVRPGGALALALAVGSTVVVEAAELHVPGQFGSIQAAIDAAQTGDHVVVAPGEYAQPIDLRGKRITLRSAAGAGATILDGGGFPSKGIIVATSGETLATVVQGFTFRNGVGTFAAACGLGGLHGGGIFVLESGLTVLDSAFVGNGVRRGDGDDVEFDITSGAAISACNSDLVVRRSRFEANYAGFGGAIRLAAQVSRQATIEHSSFTANASAHGGGVLGELFSSASLLIADSTFVDNEGVHGGGAKVVATDAATATIRASSFTDGLSNFGGGLNLFARRVATRIEVDDCDFVGNAAGFGGGLFANAFGQLPEVTGGRVTVTGSRFLDNRVIAAGGYGDGCFQDGTLGSPEMLFYGGGADVRTLYGGAVRFTNTLFAGNSAPRGGGVHASSCAGGTIDLVNTTIVGNESSGVHMRLGTSNHPAEPGLGAFLVVNSIVRGNGSDEQIPIEIVGTGPTVSVAHSNVEGGIDGAGNLDAPAGFRNPAAGDYRLARGSACIDAGDNRALVSSIRADLDGGSRFVDDPETLDTGVGTGAIVDIGADEYRPFLRRPRRTPRGPSTVND